MQTEHRPARPLPTPATPTPAAVLFAAAVACAIPAAAQDATPAAERVQTADGWVLPVNYFAPDKAGRETPVVILLAGENGNRKIWSSYAGELAKAGFAVAAPDLRKQGEATLGGQPPRSTNVSPRDYRGMVAMDLEAVKDYLLAKHAAGQLNIRKLGIVAAREAAPLALTFTHRDYAKPPLPDAPDPMMRTPRGQDVRAVVMLSPLEAVPGVTPGVLANDLRQLDVAFLTIVGERDRAGVKDAEGLHDRLAAGRETPQMALDRIPNVPLKGTDLLRIPGAQARITKFLEEYVENRPDPWRDRAGNL